MRSKELSRRSVAVRSPLRRSQRIPQARTRNSGTGSGIVGIKTRGRGTPGIYKWVQKETYL